MEKKFKIIYDREGCIGAAACAAVSSNWIIVGDGKADLVESTKNNDTEMFERDIEEKDLEKEMEAARVCPVNVIHIINKETGEKLI